MNFNVNIDVDDLERRIKYHRPDEQGIEKIAAMRRSALDWMLTIRSMVPAGREQSLAFTKIEEGLFWAIAGIARDPDNWADPD